MEDNEKTLKPIQGIIEDKDEPESIEDIIEQVTVIIRLEGEQHPICLDVESPETRAWIVDALMAKIEEDTA